MNFVAQNWLILTGLAVVIIASLSGYLVLILRKLRVQNQEQARKRSKFVLSCCDSMLTIIAATLQQQCNLSEAILRIFAIADTLNQHNNSAINLNEYPGMNKLYQEVLDHPILGARKALAKKERMKLDLRRETLEAELESVILKELQALEELLQSLRNVTVNNTPAV